MTDHLSIGTAVQKGEKEVGRETGEFWNLLSLPEVGGYFDTALLSGGFAERGLHILEKRERWSKGTVPKRNSYCCFNFILRDKSYSSELMILGLSVFVKGLLHPIVQENVSYIIWPKVWNLAILACKHETHIFCCQKDRSTQVHRLPSYAVTVHFFISLKLQG